MDFRENKAVEVSDIFFISMFPVASKFSGKPINEFYQMNPCTLSPYLKEHVLSSLLGILMEFSKQKKILQLEVAKEQRYLIFL